MQTVARHIPEDELHAYLDQGLSRSQCVEIECHLADCPACRAARNDVAAIRDRTTALLADTAPGRVSIPPFEHLVSIHRDRVSARAARFVVARRVGLAAAVILAVGAGWWGRGMLEPDAPPPEASVALVPEPNDRPTEEIALTEAPPPMPIPVNATRTLVAAGPIRPADEASGRSVRAPNPVQSIALLEPSGAVQSSVLTSEDDILALDGMWQSIDWQQAMEEIGGSLPRVSGLPVVDVQIQRTSTGERPLVVVSQAYPSGRIIRTIEGPMDRVEALLDRQRAKGADKVRASLPFLTPPDYVAGGTEAPRRVNRIFAVLGTMPADSLNVIARGIDVRE